MSQQDDRRALHPYSHIVSGDSELHLNPLEFVSDAELLFEACRPRMPAQPTRAKPSADEQGGEW